MSTQQSALTDEQLGQITDLIDALKTQLISAVGDRVNAKQAAIIASVKKEVDGAVAANQRVVLATVQAGAEKTTSTIGTKLWEAFKVLFPVVGTAVLGFFVWQWQSDIQEKIDRQTEYLKVELGLKAEFAKRKLDLYQDILTQMADVGSKVKAGQRNPEKKADVWPALLNFNQTVRSKRLYISEDAFQALLEFWQAGVDVFRGQATLDDLQTKNSNAEDKIASDLDVKTLGKLKLPQE